MLGSPGGSRIITIMLEAIINVIDYGMDPQEAVDAPRFHHQWLPDEVYVEPYALSPDTRQMLTDMGYKIVEQTPWGAAEGDRRSAASREPGSRTAKWPTQSCCERQNEARHDLRHQRQSPPPRGRRSGTKTCLHPPGVTEALACNFWRWRRSTEFSPAFLAPRCATTMPVTIRGSRRRGRAEAVRRGRRWRRLSRTPGSDRRRGRRGWGRSNSRAQAAIIARRLPDPAPEGVVERADLRVAERKGDLASASVSFSRRFSASVLRTSFCSSL